MNEQILILTAQTMYELSIKIVKWQDTTFEKIIVNVSMFYNLNKLAQAYIIYKQI